MANLNFLGANHSYVLGKVNPPLDGQALLGLATWLNEPLADPVADPVDVSLNAPLDPRFPGDNPAFNVLALATLSLESQQALYSLGLDNWSNTLNLDMAEKQG